MAAVPFSFTGNPEPRTFCDRQSNPAVNSKSQVAFVSLSDLLGNDPWEHGVSAVALLSAASEVASDQNPPETQTSPPDRASAETAPIPPVEEIPVGDPAIQDRVKVTVDRDRLSLTARDAPLGAVVSMIAQQHGLNIVAPEGMTQRLTVTLNNVGLHDALDTLLAMHGFTWMMQRNMLIITAVDAAQKAAPSVQGRIVHVFCLNYVAAMEVDKVVKGLLSPVGQSFIVQAMPTDQRRTAEQLVVEDLPGYVQRIAEYVQRVDCQPRQVLVEAHVLQVQLKDDCKHGVDFEQVLHVANSNVYLQMQGFANAADSPGSFIRIEGTDFNAVIEALKSTTDSKTLASPKIAVLNGQEARIQVGGQIGYLTTTATETSAVQTVNFLDTGVILRVLPVITDDRHILLDVKPQVSSGRINTTTNLPETDTTEVVTKVMLADGEAIVIGGLIKEIDTEIENKIPWLGDIPYLGRIFQKRTVLRERSEVIIALLPRIINDIPCQREFCPPEVERARTPLFEGPLDRVDRTAWEPFLRSATYPLRVPPTPVPDFCMQPPGAVYGPAPPPQWPGFNAPHPAHAHGIIGPTGQDVLPLPTSLPPVPPPPVPSPPVPHEPVNRLPPVTHLR